LEWLIRKILSPQRYGAPSSENKPCTGHDQGSPTDPALTDTSQGFSLGSKAPFSKNACGKTSFVVVDNLRVILTQPNTII
jgi:hypothetical protein